jgi:hypothetical protein
MPDNLKRSYIAESRQPLAASLSGHPLGDAIGADDDTAAALLLKIGARRSAARGKDSWGLISRAPFLDDLPRN